MTINTLAYTKAFETAGLERSAAEALISYVPPDLVTKADLAVATSELQHAMERLEQRLTWRVVSIVGALNALLFALLRFVH